MHLARKVRGCPLCQPPIGLNCGKSAQHRSVKGKPFGAKSCGIHSAKKSPPKGRSNPQHLTKRGAQWYTGPLEGRCYIKAVSPPLSPQANTQGGGGAYGRRTVDERPAVHRVLHHRAAVDDSHGPESVLAARKPPGRLT